MYKTARGIIKNGKIILEEKAYLKDNIEVMVTFLDKAELNLKEEILAGISAGFKDVEEENLMSLEESKQRMDKIING